MSCPVSILLQGGVPCPVSILLQGGVPCPVSILLQGGVSCPVSVYCARVGCHVLYPYTVTGWGVMSCVLGITIINIVK